MDKLYRELNMSLRHFHLVTLVGYCEQRPALVFNYMGGGTLQTVLRDT